MDFDVDANEVNLKPPFVPPIGGPEDTTHFEEVEASELRAVEQRNKRQQSKGAFNPKDLDYMGFTYSCEDAVLEGFGQGLANTTMTGGDESMMLEARTKELSLTKEQRDRHKRAAAEAHAQVASMKWRMTTMSVDKERLQMARNEAAALKDENRSLHREVRQLQTTVDELKSDLDTTRADLRTALDNLASERDRAQKTTEHLRRASSIRGHSDATVFQDQLKDADATNRQLQQQLAQANRESERLREELKVAQRQRSGARSQVSELEAELSSVKDSLGRRERELQRADSIMKEYKEQVVSLEVSQKEIIERDLQAIRDAADDLQLAHDDQARLKSRVNKYRERCKDATFQAREWKLRYEEQVNSREKFRQHYKKQIIKLEAELRAVQSGSHMNGNGRRESQTVRSAARTRVAARGSVAGGVQEELQAKDRQIARLKVELANLQDDYKGTLDRLVAVENGLNVTQLSESGPDVSATGLDGLYAQIGGKHPHETSGPYDGVEGHRLAPTVMTPSPRVPSRLRPRASDISVSSMSSTGQLPSSPFHRLRKPPMYEVSQALKVMSIDGGGWQDLQLLLSSSWVYFALPEDHTVAVYEHCLSDTDAVFRLHASVPRSQLRQLQLDPGQVDLVWAVSYRTSTDIGDSLVLLSNSKADKASAIAGLNNAIRIHESPLNYQILPALELDEGGRVQDIICVPDRHDTFFLATVNGIDILELAVGPDGVRGTSTATGNYEDEVYEVVTVPTDPDVLVLLTGPYRRLALCSGQALLDSTQPVPYSPRKRAARRQSFPTGASAHPLPDMGFARPIADAQNIDQFALGCVDGQTYLLSASKAMGLVLYTYNPDEKVFAKRHVANDSRFTEPVVDLRWCDTLQVFIWTTDIFNRFDPVTLEASSMLDRDQPSLRQHFEREASLNVSPKRFVALTEDEFLLAFVEYGLVVNRHGCLVGAQAELDWHCGPLRDICHVQHQLCVVGEDGSVGLLNYGNGRWHHLNVEDVLGVMVANDQLFVSHQRDVNTYKTTLSLVQRPLQRLVSSFRNSTRNLRELVDKSDVKAQVDEIDALVDLFQTSVSK
eukprot:TRINITY_DN10711_c0_g1_i1.p1 TRINITY_DN10711_c0_g1~~TRINITY_DN10711_c0_g1_i1.p1  ORF type:complete len:1190 (+),score=310.24 TRINITY_DN10711_c0_g1_i1:372-3572(+)